MDSKTVTKIIPPSAVERTQRQIAECKRFRGLTRDFVEVSEKICDAQLRAPTEGAGREVKKKRRSPGRCGAAWSKKSKIFWA
jgi:hypothetical protein